MLLAERKSDRSPGPSPNGHASESSSNGESRAMPIDGEGGARSITHGYLVQAKTIRVGRDSQAILPDLILATERRLDQVPDGAVRVWSPTTLPDSIVDEFVDCAKKMCRYSDEQALGMLFWHNSDLESAVMDLPNHTPMHDEWTSEEKVLFERAFQAHGKSFHHIRLLLPYKTLASLVKFYYTWKKTRSGTRSPRKIATNRDEGSEVGSGHSSNNPDGKDKGKTGGKRLLGRPAPKSVKLKRAAKEARRVGLMALEESIKLKSVN